MKIVIDIPDKYYAFIKDLKSLIIGGRGGCRNIQYNVVNAIKNGTPLPTGEWIDTGRTWEETVDGFIHHGNVYKCSVCKAEVKGLTECTSFCKYCGANMKGGEEE